MTSQFCRLPELQRKFYHIGSPSYIFLYNPQKPQSKSCYREKKRSDGVTRSQGFFFFFCFQNFIQFHGTFTPIRKLQPSVRWFSRFYYSSESMCRNFLHAILLVPVRCVYCHCQKRRNTLVLLALCYLSYKATPWTTMLLKKLLIATYRKFLSYRT
jgi:hypothetical protein